MRDTETDAAASHGARRTPEEQEFARLLGVAVRRHRVAQGLTQEGLAQRAALSRASIANIERGTQTPQVYRLSLVAEALSCSLSDLVPGSMDVVDLQLNSSSRSALDNVLRASRSRRVTT